MALLDVRHLTKRWPTGRLALDDVSFEVKEGEILGLLGHNGAGKSTIMGITLGMVRPDMGEVRIGAVRAVSVQERRHHEPVLRLHRVQQFDHGAKRLGKREQAERQLCVVPTQTSSHGAKDHGSSSRGGPWVARPVGPSWV